VTKDFLKRKIEAFKRTKAIKAKLEYGNVVGFSWVCSKEFRDKLANPESLAHKYSYYAENRGNFGDFFERFAHLCGIVGVKNPKPRIPLEDQFFEQYPIFKFMDDSHLSPRGRLSLEEAVLYVKAKDASKGETECDTSITSKPPNP
jgi:hypothetical protein